MTSIHMHSLLMNIFDVMALNTDLVVATHLNINILPLLRLLSYCRRFMRSSFTYSSSRNYPFLFQLPRSSWICTVSIFKEPRSHGIALLTPENTPSILSESGGILKISIAIWCRRGYSALCSSRVHHWSDVPNIGVGTPLRNLSSSSSTSLWSVTSSARRRDSNFAFRITEFTPCILCSYHSLFVGGSEVVEEGDALKVSKCGVFSHHVMLHHMYS